MTKIAVATGGPENGPAGKIPKQYIGDKEISFVTDIDDKTPIGSDMVLVSFADGTSRRFPKMLYKRLAQDHQIDATSLRTLWVDPLINQVIVLMQESDLKMEDIDYFVNTMLASIEQKCNVANARLYGVDFYPQRSLLAIERILNDKPTSTTSEDIEGK